MNRILIAALAAGTAISAAAPAFAMHEGATMTHQAFGPTLSFSVEHEVRSKPDVASVGAGVEVTAQTAVEAMRQNAEAMDGLIKAVKARGIKEEDIQTSGINLSPQYDYSNRSQGQPPRFIGYQVSNNVSLRTENIEKIGELLDALVAAGGNNISGPSFGMKDREALMEGSRSILIAKAKAKAEDYARLTGYRTTELVSINEGGFSAPVMQPRMMMEMAAAPALAKSTPVEPGQVRSAMNINVTYRLVR